MLKKIPFKPTLYLTLSISVSLRIFIYIKMYDVQYFDVYVYKKKNFFLKNFKY